MFIVGLLLVLLIVIIFWIAYAKHTNEYMCRAEWHEKIRAALLNDLYWTREYALLDCYGVTAATQYTQSVWTNTRDNLSSLLGLDQSLLRDHMAKTIALIDAIKTNDPSKNQTNDDWFLAVLNVVAQYHLCNISAIVNYLTAVRNMIEHIALAASDHHDSDGKDIDQFTVAQNMIPALLNIWKIDEQPKMRGAASTKRHKQRDTDEYK